MCVLVAFYMRSQIIGYGIRVMCILCERVSLPPTRLHLHASINVCIFKNKHTIRAPVVSCLHCVMEIQTYTRTHTHAHICIVVAVLTASSLFQCAQCQHRSYASARVCRSAQAKSLSQTHARTGVMSVQCAHARAHDFVPKPVQRPRTRSRSMQFVSVGGVPAISKSPTRNDMIYDTRVGALAVLIDVDLTNHRA